jgi:hypothetical protein
VTGHEVARQRAADNVARAPAEAPVLKHLRIAFLLYILLFVALGEWLASWRSTSWDDSLWVNIYLVNGDGSAVTQQYLDGIEPDAFAGIEQFFAGQAREYGVELDAPFRVWLAGQLDEAPPPVPAHGGWLDVMLWSLKTRWFVTRLHWASDGPTPDITLFAIYEDGGHGATLDRSTALEKGMIAIAHLFARREMHGSNQMIIAHEVLHTLGARDKYDLATTLPLHPIGFAEPGRTPRYPQAQAELMAGRIPLGPAEAATPQTLRQVMIGPATAHEIGWAEAPP